MIKPLVLFALLPGLAGCALPDPSILAVIGAAASVVIREHMKETPPAATPAPAPTPVQEVEEELEPEEETEEAAPVATPTPQAARAPTPRPTGEVKCGGESLRFLGRKSAQGLLILRSHTQGGFKLLTPAACGSIPEAKVVNRGGKITTGKFCGFANENRAHYCLSSLRRMPTHIVLGSKTIPVPARCKNTSRCE